MLLEVLAGILLPFIGTALGSANATVNFMTQKLIVEFAQGADPAEVMPRMQKNCKKVAHDCEIFL